MAPNTTPGTPAATPGTGLNDAATQFEALLGAAPAAAPSPPRVAAKLTAAPAEEAEPQPADDPNETPPEDAEQADAESNGEEAEAAEGSEAEGEQPAPDPLYTVKIHGKEEQITLKEALSGYQRQADYSRAMNETAEERKSLVSERQTLQAERAQYSQLLDTLAAQLQEAAPQEPDWQKLYEANPMEYMRQKDIWRENQEQQKIVAEERARVQNLQAQDVAQTVRRVIAEGRQKLPEAIPAWKDQARFEADRVKLREYGKSKLGFSDQELDQAYDYRAVVALYKAMQYDALMEKRPVPVQQAAPRVARPGTPTTAASRSASDLTRAKQRLAQTGRIDDAAKAFESLL